MTEASKIEAKVQKHIDDALAKIEALNGSKSPAPPAVRERLQEILLNLALRSALAGGPEKCKECEEKLDSRLAVRCPKHVALVLASDFAKAKVKEHGPTLAMKAMGGVQAWFEKLTSESEKDDEKDGESKKKDDDA